MEKKNQGFTLLEIMVVVAIVALLAAIAVPAYKSHARKNRRSDGHAALLNAAKNMEQYYSNNYTYAGAAVGTTFEANSEKEFYVLSFSSAPTASTYEIQAVPQGDQANDPCGTLTIDQTGKKTPADCW